MRKAENSVLEGLQKTKDSTFDYKVTFFFVILIKIVSNSDCPDSEL